MYLFPEKKPHLGDRGFGGAASTKVEKFRYVVKSLYLGNAQFPDLGKLRKRLSWAGVRVEALAERPRWRRLECHMEKFRSEAPELAAGLDLVLFSPESEGIP